MSQNPTDQNQLHPYATIGPAYIEVTFREQGFHRWPDAPERRSYLRHTHRHLFHVTVRIRVTHDERQIEFHDLLDDCRGVFRRMVQSQEGASCETMARQLLSHVISAYDSVQARVTVSEDGECSAIVGAII